MKKLLISGANGQLGRELAEKKSPDGIEMIFLDREAMDFLKPEKFKEIFDHYRPDYFINCAAYTAVDKAEEDKETCMQVNGHSLKQLAIETKRRGCKLIHISTDYVFDGMSPVPYNTDDQPKPLNSYGASKLLGERLAQENDPYCVIVRTAWVYSIFGNNFVKTMLRLLSSRDQISVVSDQTGSPTYAADLAEALLTVILSPKWSPGIYHYTNSGKISWFDFAEAVRESLQSSCKIIPITTSEYPTAAKRPMFSLLNSEKIVDDYGVKLYPWRDRLALMLSKLQKA